MSAHAEVDSTLLSPTAEVLPGTLCLWRGLIGKIEAWRHTPDGLCCYVSGISINGVERVYWLASDDVEPIHIGEDSSATTYTGRCVTARVEAFLTRG